MSNDFELVEQARLADPRLADRRDDLAVTGAREFAARDRVAPSRASRPDEFREPASRRSLQARSQRTQPDHLVNIDEFAEPFDAGRPERLQREVSLDEAARVFGNRNRAGRRERLHPRGEAGRMPNRRVLGVQLVGSDVRTTASPVLAPMRTSIGESPASRNRAE